MNVVFLCWSVNRPLHLISNHLFFFLRKRREICSSPLLSSPQQYCDSLCWWAAGAQTFSASSTVWVLLALFFLLWQLVVVLGARQDLTQQQYFLLPPRRLCLSLVIDSWQSYTKTTGQISMKLGVSVVWVNQSITCYFYSPHSQNTIRLIEVNKVQHPLSLFLNKRKEKLPKNLINRGKQLQSESHVRDPSARTNRSAIDAGADPGFCFL